MNIFSTLKKSIISNFSIENLIFLILLCMVVSVSIYLHDGKITTIYVICSFLATILAGKGKVSCYFFGIFSTLCYSFLTFKSALFGSFALNAFYYLPMNIIGVFEWKKHLKAEKNEIVKTFLSIKMRYIISTIILFGAAIAGMILKYTGDKFPFIDGFVVILSVAAVYLTVKRCIEQWILWTIVNLLTVIMWLILVTNGSHSFATLLLWSIYLCLGIYFFIRWFKEITNSPAN